jgi:hypothetical protein
MTLKFNQLLWIITGALLCACTTARPILGPDGSENQLISCSAVESCYEEATDVCHGTYKIVNTSSETSGSDGTTSTTVKLLVKCAQ